MLMETTEHQTQKSRSDREEQAGKRPPFVTSHPAFVTSTFIFCVFIFKYCFCITSAEFQNMKNLHFRNFMVHRSISNKCKYNFLNSQNIFNAGFNVIA